MTNSCMMDLHKLNISATIARVGNFTRAAELLCMTQPAVSQQLAQLEKEIGVRNTAELLEMIAQDQVEIALAGSPAKREGVEITPFMEDRLVAIVSPEDELPGAHRPHKQQ